ncbi:MAG: alkaline phosphatase family protein, partial [Solirubrobacteraceae bacterium]
LPPTPSAPAPAPVAAISPSPAPAAPAAEEPADDEEPADTTPAADEPEPSKVGHVFVIALTGTGVEQTFGDASPAPYLAGELRPKGALLDNYTPLDKSDLTNYIALASGQPANEDTRAECATYRDFGSDAKVDKKGIVSGDGCVYPNTVLTLGDQVTSSGHSWRAYAEDMDKGEDPAVTCRRPDLPSEDPTLVGRPADQYATRHNPFVYFHSLLDLSDCLANDLTLATLTTDLESERTTPNLSFIAPNLCNSGTEAPCADGRPGGLPEADKFLQEWVPRIMASKAYKKDGLIMITFLSSAVTGAGVPPSDAAADAPPPRTGVLLLSKFAKAGGTSYAPYSPFSLLRSIEDLFALKPLAKAAKASSFAESVLPKAFG